MTRASTGRFAVVGTAGHIDHGKTSLVRLLTGVDTDRLKEEKERGISIDLGFAHLTLPDGSDLGIVDVPGHERFIRNMLAGVAGIDAVLLVVAADEGVMPQTREHFDILSLLGVKRGVVALTKTDMVEPEWLDIVREDVTEYLAGTLFESAEIVPVSSKTGAGREELLAALSRSLTELAERPAQSPPRLPIDRAFTVEGFGTVVTGTLWRGTLKAGDRVVIEPAHIETRVRSVQVHNDDVEEARAGRRTAVALHGVDRASIGRGDWVLAPGTLEASYMVDARVNLLKDCPRPLVHRQRIRFHLGAGETLGRVFLLEGDEIRPGDSAIVQFRLEAPVVADRGDHFVMRSYSPQRAIGGGTVLVPNPEKHGRNDALAVARLGVEEEGGVEDKVLQALESFPLGATIDAVAGRAGLPAAETGSALAALEGTSDVFRVDDDRRLSASAFEALAAQVMEACRRHQKGAPFRWGLSRGELKSLLPKEADAALFRTVTEVLASQARLFVRGDRYRADSAELVLTPGDQDRIDRTLAALRADTYSPPTVRELEQKTGLGPILGEILQFLVLEEKLVKLGTELYYPADILETMRTRTGEFFEDHEEMRVSDLKDLFGLSRKHSIPVFEYFDRIGVTRRMGDVRVRGRLLAER